MHNARRLACCFGGAGMTAHFVALNMFKNILLLMVDASIKFYSSSPER